MPPPPPWALPYTAAGRSGSIATGGPATSSGPAGSRVDARSDWTAGADAATTALPRERRDDPADRTTPRRRPQPRGAHLPPYRAPLDGDDAGPTGGRGTPRSGPGRRPGAKGPRKLTVTRVAAYRSRELTQRGVELFHRAATADGADKSGLTALTYAVMGNYAVDAALTVALANTIFFADTGSTGKVLTYLLITVAPFAVVAPLIGPLLDRMQSGRRLALAVSSFGRALLAVLMAFNFTPFNPWVIYPAALGNLVLSKAFSVLKAALTPRVLPEQITLVKTNSRLTVFGLVAGGAAGLVAAGILKLTGSPGALVFCALCAVAGGVLCLRIPSWVESTEGEVPLRGVIAPRSSGRGFPRIVRATLWANCMVRVETGFLALFIAFVVKNQYPTDHQQNSAFFQLLLLGVVGGAAGVGGFVGNALGARLNLSAPEVLALICLSGTGLATLVAAVVPGLATAAVVGFVGSTASSLAKVCLDSVIQHELPEVSRASAFGRSESILQLSWVFGGVVGLLVGGVWFGHVSAVYSIGFGVVTVLLAVGTAQCLLVRSGRSMLPRLALPRPRLRRRSRGGTGTGRTPATRPLPTGTAAPATGEHGTAWGDDLPSGLGGPADPFGDRPDPGPAAGPATRGGDRRSRNRPRKAGSGR
ncbi:MFS transporter [Nakamurella endophytica]|uniref:MFS transporter n=1 Tax=Nakamurella endophytica TaxID=1748367 RepID=UPI0016697B4B|nr:MFS transporter [Nakamurella endophytica]